MRRFIAILLAFMLIVGLCACNKDEVKETERDCGVFVTIEADDVYTVSCGTESGSDSASNADGTALEAGFVAHFDFSGEAAESSAKAVFDYSICIYDENLDIIADASFSDNFANNAKIEIVVTKDHVIAYAGDKVTCGETVITFSTAKPSEGISIMTANVSMPNNEAAAEKINASLTQINDTFKGDFKAASKSAYDENVKNAGKNADISDFSMERTVTVERGNSDILSFKMIDTVNLGTEKQITVTGHNYNPYTGAEIKFADLSNDVEGLKAHCSEEVLVSTTENANFLEGSLIFNEGYTETLSSLVSDGHWYMNEEGIVIVANPGDIADADDGLFEFVVPYDDLEGYLKAEFLACTLKGENGDISAEFTNGAKLDDYTLIGSKPDSDKNCVLVSVTGNIYSVSAYTVKYSESEKTSTIADQLFFCSDLCDGAAFIIGNELSGKNPGLLISFARPDGSMQYRLLASDGEGGINVTNPYGGELGSNITEKLPYSGDLNGDDEAETLNASKGDDGAYKLTVTAADGDRTQDLLITEKLRVHLFDLNDNGTAEIIVCGNDKDGNALTYAFSYDGKLNAIKFGDSSHVKGEFKGFSDGKVKMQLSLDMLGSYTVDASYTYSDGKLSRSGSMTFVDNDKYLTTAKELILSDNTILPANYKIRFTSTNGSSTIDFVTDGGLKGTLKVSHENGKWLISGKDYTTFFK